MRVLFLTRLDHADRYVSGEDAGTELVPELPTSQDQHRFVAAFRRLGHQVRVERYTDAALVDAETGYRIASRLNETLGLGYRALRELRWRLPPRFDPDARARNRRAIGAATSFDPDLVLVTGGYHYLTVGTIRRIKDRTGAPVVGLNGVGPFDFGSRRDRHVAPRAFDLMLVNDEYRRRAWQAVGVDSVVVPLNGCDTGVARPHREHCPEYEADVSFVGQPYPRRVMYLEPLMEAGIDVAVYGPGWEETPLAPHHRGSAYGPDLYRAIHSSKISINVHHRVQLAGGNMKTFEIPAAGTMQIADACDPGWFVPGEEIVLVDSPADLLEQVTYYLDHEEEREAIARRGTDRAETDHTYEDRVERVCELVSGGGRDDGVVAPEHLDAYSIL